MLVRKQGGASGGRFLPLLQGAVAAFAGVLFTSVGLAVFNGGGGSEIVAAYCEEDECEAGILCESNEGQQTGCDFKALECVTYGC
jgi:hypothetical protein